MRCGALNSQGLMASGCPWSPLGPWIPVRSASDAHQSWQRGGAVLAEPLVSPSPVSAAQRAAGGSGEGSGIAIPPLGGLHHECRRAD